MMFKFQQGGAVSAPLVSYLPIMPSDTKASSKENSPKKDSVDLTDKDLFAMLEKMDGLPSDMTVLTQKLKNFYLDSKYNRGNTSNIESRYLLVLNDLKVASFNKKEYDSAYTASAKNGSINETAINERGQIFCIDTDTGDFTLLSPEELNKKTQYLALTNSELLYYRAHYPTMANKNNVLQIVKTGVSMSDINSIIKDIIDSIGTDQSTDSGFIKSNQLILGLQDFAKAISLSNGIGTIGGLYKYELLTKDLSTNAKKAMNYIYRTMPENMKTLLKIKSGSNSLEGALELIETLVASLLDETQDFSINIEDKKTAASSNSGGLSGVNTDIEHNPVIAFAIGTGNSVDIKLNIGSSVGFNVLGRESILVNKTGEPLGANDTFQDVTKSAYAPILDINNATFGGVKLDINLSNLFLLDSSTITGMDLPVDEEALEHGIIKPNLELTRRIESAELEIREGNITDLESKDAIYDKYGLPARFKDASGHYNLSLIPYRRFGRITGLLDGTALPEDSELDGTVYEITDSHAIDNAERIFKNKDKDYVLRGGFLGIGGTELYKGAIYIPIKEDVVSATLGMGDYVSVGDAMSMKARLREVEAENAQAEKIKTYQKAQSLSTLQ